MSEGAAVEVAIRTHGIRRLRVAAALPRCTLALLAALGILASARMLVDPPRAAPAQVAVAGEARDRAAEAYAVLFARRYLSWDAADPGASARVLEGFAGAALEAAAGLSLPATGAQRVLWAEVAQAREPSRGEHVYTIAAETRPEGLLYMTVTVARTAEGALELAGYPAFVGAPDAVAARSQQRSRPVGEAALETVVRRALANYLAGAGSELAADLAPGAAVAAPALQLQLLSVQRIVWAPGGAVTAVLQAQDRRGVRYTLAYEVDVARAQGRWEISAIQTLARGAS